MFVAGSEGVKSEKIRSDEHLTYDFIIMFLYSGFKVTRPTLFLGADPKKFLGGLTPSLPATNIVRTSNLHPVRHVRT